MRGGQQAGRLLTAPAAVVGPPPPPLPVPQQGALASLRALSSPSLRYTHFRTSAAAPWCATLCFQQPRHQPTAYQSLFFSPRLSLGVSLLSLPLVVPPHHCLLVVVFFFFFCQHHRLANPPAPQRCAKEGRPRVGRRSSGRQARAGADEAGQASNIANEHNHASQGRA